MIYLAITVLCAGFVVYASFCRLSKTSKRTVPSVRFAIVMMAGCGIVAIVAPFAWGWKPDFMHAGLFAAVAAHQWVTRRTWAHGVPHLYLRRDACPRH